MGLLTLTCAVTRELLGAALRRDAGKASQSNPVGVSYPQLTQLQVRCLLSASAFWMALTAVALPSLLLFGILLIPMWIAAEAVFFVWWLMLYRRLNAQPNPHRPAQHENPREVFDRFINEQPAISRYIDIHDMMSKWHWNVPASQLTRGNVADLLCYGFFYRSQQQLAAEGQPHLPDQLVSELEAAWGVRFNPGPYTPLPLMTHLWEPVRCFYRPLFFYAGVELLVLLKHVMLRAAGFRAYRHNGMRYYTYGLPAIAPRSSSSSPAPSPTSPSTTTTTTSHSSQPLHTASSSQPTTASNAAPTPPSAASTAASDAAAAAATAPILFLHGVGLGLLPYLNFLLRLSSLRRPVVAVEVRHLSMRVCTTIPEEDEVVADIVGALARHDVRQVHVAAHSYGTFMASRLVQLHTPMVASLTLLDPVCFAMFSGKLIYNFVYRSPSAGASLLTWFIARDLAHAASVARRFYWSLLNLWPDQLPPHTLVALSAEDELVPVQEVLTMLEARPATRVLLHPSHRHADFIKDLPWQARMVQEVAELIHQASYYRASSSPTSSFSPSTAAAAMQHADGDAVAVQADAAAAVQNGPQHRQLRMHMHHQDNSMQVQGPLDSESEESGDEDEEEKERLGAAADAAIAVATITATNGTISAHGKKHHQQHLLEQRCGDDDGSIAGDVDGVAAAKHGVLAGRQVLQTVRCKDGNSAANAASGKQQQQQRPATASMSHLHHSRSDSASSYEVMVDAGSRLGGGTGSGGGDNKCGGGSGKCGSGIPTGKKKV